MKKLVLLIMGGAIMAFCSDDNSTTTDGGFNQIRLSNGVDEYQRNAPGDTKVVEGQDVSFYVITPTSSVMYENILITADNKNSFTYSTKNVLSDRRNSGKFLSSTS